MKILNFGSLNIDYVYNVEHIVTEGETLGCKKRGIFAGGKGLNQSIAIARAGGNVYHAGKIGQDGEMLLSICREAGVHTEYIQESIEATGHTIIQVDESGQNCILLYGGANQNIEKEDIDEVLKHFTRGDMLVLQNEISNLPYLVDRAAEYGLQMVLNPSPYNAKLEKVDFSKISIFLLNEIEGGQMTGEHAPEKILERMLALYPNARVVLTLGKAGSIYRDQTQEYHQKIYAVKAVDTTAAGDTFTGYFLTALAEKLPIPEALDLAAKASAIAVTRNGAVPSIPQRTEVDAFH
jgi:ribokinase